MASSASVQGYTASVEDAGASRIGPNTVLQTLSAVERGFGRVQAERIRCAAGLPEAETLDGMIPETWFVRILSALRDVFEPAVIEGVLRESGRETARYVAAHRIPSVARFVLRALPSVVAVPMLLHAIRKHAWTFAGRGGFRVERGARGTTLHLEDSPTCRLPAPALGGAWYEAAFETLLRDLADPRIRVFEVACTSAGAAECVFLVRRGPDSERLA